MFKDEATKSVIDNTNQRWCFITIKIDNFVKIFQQKIFNYDTSMGVIVNIIQRWHFLGVVESINQRWCFLKASLFINIYNEKMMLYRSVIFSLPWHLKNVIVSLISCSGGWAIFEKSLIMYWPYNWCWRKPLLQNMENFLPIIISTNLSIL